MEQSNGLFNGYAHNEGKFIADQILHFKSTYLQNIIAPKIKEVDLSIQRIAHKARLNSMLEYTMLCVYNVKESMIYS